ncbi:hypothetical protein LPB137_08875 [Poseidonibacter parvus]|uniref:histidine kinase n=1 Tax=Poseidonibacter parvus TaxID=1850254 RepID=A0A1P8KN12_9BACT|nr:ArsS family sensor histidine kinase [Poseidonibacter parvus]APW65962.1 hypothetical protein LPB137_08875 [Poseidonibacter parvus]
MNLNSITSKISLVFLISISILIALFFFYIDYEKKRKYVVVERYYENITKYLKEHRMDKYDLINHMKSLPFEIVEKPKEVLENSNSIIMKREYDLLEYKDILYFHIKTPFTQVLFKDLNMYSFSNYSYIIFVFLLLLLISLYIWLIRSLQPLKDLKTNITSFSQGNLSINCKSDKKDEIADVSNEFDKAVRKIELLLNSRQLFLRTIMHELKTPIAKGRIVSELIDDEKQKGRMVNIFKRLDFLINDFSKVEQVVSQNYKITKQIISLSLIFDDAFKSLLLENSNDKIFLNLEEEKKVKADLSLMSMVFKNLIDNALRYSSDGKVKIKQNENEIIFISKGVKLQKDINEYFKPFHNDVESKNHGMGLGLYIVKSILNMHNYEFEYEYIDDNNIFKIIINH